MSYFAACERILGEASSERIEELSSRISLTPMEALAYAQAMGVDRRLRVEQTKVMALLPVLISLSVDLNSLVSFKANKPMPVVDVALHGTFDAMDQSFRRQLGMIREFLHLGHPLSGVNSFNESVQRLTESVRQMIRADRFQQTASDSMGDVLVGVSRYLEIAEAFTECTALIATLNLEEFINDNVL